MADIDVAKIQAQIQSFKSENPDKVSGKTDAEIISIMMQQGKISHNTATKVSIMMQNGEFPISASPKKATSAKAEAGHKTPPPSKTHQISAFDSNDTILSPSTPTNKSGSIIVGVLFLLVMK